MGYDFKPAVVTERECGAEIVCAQHGIPFIRIEYTDREVFSAKAAQWLYDEHKVDFTVLFFSRLVGNALYSRAPCINIHPSLLPAFPGFGALKSALKAGVKFFGATAHLVDHSIDGGLILAQAVAPLRKGAALADIERISFAQKLYLLLVIWEAAKMGSSELGANSGESEVCVTKKGYANPPLRDEKLEESFLHFVKEEGIPWPQ
jgi:phosphoribosylglycinamide formyltransferase-1